MSKEPRANQQHHDVPAVTRRPEVPALEGREPLPEELTGLASGSSDDLTTLFGDATPAHITDGFRGGSDDDVGSDIDDDAIEVEPGVESDAEGNDFLTG